MSERTFDVVVVGAGVAGEVVAGHIADGGLSVAITESHLIGGECSYYACMPSKGLLRPGELLAEVQRVPGARDAVTGDLDVAAVLARRDEIIHDLDDSGQLPWLADKGIELFRGESALDGERRVRVGDDVLVAERAVIVATGSSAAVPPIPGLAEAKPWTNREATTAKEVPARLAILGGGVVGVEMAQAYRSLGAQVTVIEMADRVLALEEPFAAEQVADSLRSQGVDVRLGSGATAVSRAENGEVTIEIDGGATVVADELLVAVGRAPNTKDIGVESVGLEPGKAIEVDEKLRATAVEGGWLYAVGDANMRAPLTHMGKYQARVAAADILGTGEMKIESDGRQSPRVTFTEPQVAAVGHTLKSAEDAGIAARAIDIDTQGTAGGSFIGKGAPGTCRFVLDDSRGVLVGATFTGVEVGEWLHAATIAVIGEVPLERMRHAVVAYPTRSEVWLYFMAQALE